MLTGTLIIKISAELFEKQSIEILQNTMYQHFISISDKFDFDYRRFGYISARLTWVIPLKVFWKNDLIYTVLKSSLNHYFQNWELDMTLIIEEKGD